YIRDTKALTSTPADVKEYPNIYKLEREKNNHLQVKDQHLQVRERERSTFTTAIREKERDHRNPKFSNVHQRFSHESKEIN
ncbi:hypothetical protein GIB67_039180, partial [Kingdonia uniflora]